jgi:hypothetical protein
MFVKVEYNNTRFCYKEIKPSMDKLHSFIKSRFRNLSN